MKIKNRKGQHISILIDERKPYNGLVFIMHGLSGFKEQLHIQEFRFVFKNKGFTTVSFDTTNTFGESDGAFENATITNYYEDLVDVINWAKTQKWYQKPFCLAGHSVGGYCCALYAENYPSMIKGLAPISTVVSGKLILNTRPKWQVDEWRKTGWLVEESTSNPGLIKRLKWAFAKDSLKHDLLPNSDKLIMPVLMIVGGKDARTPLKQQKILFDKLKGVKELHVIKDATHTYINHIHLEDIKDIFGKWIDKITTVL